MNIGRGLRVYVAGPVNGSGKQHENAHRAIQVAEMLTQAGFVCYVPHLNWLWHFMMPEITEERILEMCRSWVLACDIFVRLPGASPGSDFEEGVARGAKKPIFKNDANIGDHLVPARLLIREAKRWGEHNTEHVPAVFPPVCLPEEGMPVDYEQLKQVLYPSLNLFQQDVESWCSRQPFANPPPHQPLLGVLEELGELAHAHLKNEQKIRGYDDPQKTLEAKKDAVGDMMVYLVNYCEVNGLRLGDCLEHAWSQVRTRDWTKNSATGKAASLQQAYDDRQLSLGEGEG